MFIMIFKIKYRDMQKIICFQNGFKTMKKLKMKKN